jgi:hypothetical protein
VSDFENLQPDLDPPDGVMPPKSSRPVRIHVRRDGFDLPGGESTAAALRRVEQERDDLQEGYAAAQATIRALIDGAEKLLAERDEALEEVRALRHSESLEVLGLHAALAKKVRDLDLARAELESARQELDALRIIREGGHG